MQINDTPGITCPCKLDDLSAVGSCRDKCKIEVQLCCVSAYDTLMDGRNMLTLLATISLM